VTCGFACRRYAQRSAWLKLGDRQGLNEEAIGLCETAGVCLFVCFCFVRVLVICLCLCVVCLVAFNFVFYSTGIVCSGGGVQD